jgi:PhnB protein
MSEAHVPAGYSSVTPYIICSDAVAALDFYTRAFGAVETLRLAMPDGSIAHAEFRIGNAMLMLGQENPEWGTKSPTTLGGSPCGFMIYVPDCDAAFAQALGCGATVEKPLADQFYGDRSGSVVDPFGHIWTLATKVREMTGPEMKAAMDGWIQSVSHAA